MPIKLPTPLGVVRPAASASASNTNSKQKGAPQSSLRLPPLPRAASPAREAAAGRTWPIAEALPKPRSEAPPLALPIVGRALFAPRPPAGPAPSRPAFAGRRYRLPARRIAALAPVVPPEDGARLQVVGHAAATSRFSIPLRPFGFQLRELELGASLGAGAFGEVVRARHRTTGEAFAVKRIPLEGLSPRERAALGAEARALQWLNGHPAIIATHGVDVGPESLAIVMELGDRDLDTELSARPDRTLGSAALRDAFGALLSGLAAAHARGIAHRDVKPQNLILSRDGRVKLADFGAGRLLSRGNLANTAIGTPHYMAPEVIDAMFRGQPYDAKKADIWSAGVVLYEMATGQRPFLGHDWMEIRLKMGFRGVEKSQLDLAPIRDPELARLVESTLQTDPKKRPDAKALLASDWIRGR